MSKRSDLIDAISMETGIMKTTIGEVLDAQAKVTQGKLKRFEPVEIPGVVALRVAPRGERNARNPATGEMIRVPAMNVVKARPAKAIRTV